MTVPTVTDVQRAVAVAPLLRPEPALQHKLEGLIDNELRCKTCERTSFLSEGLTIEVKISLWYEKREILQPVPWTGNP